MLSINKIESQKLQAQLAITAVGSQGDEKQIKNTLNTLNSKEAPTPTDGGISKEKADEIAKDVLSLFKG
jgi:hypothetical protein